jgi:putative ABC transport system permease protein
MRSFLATWWAALRVARREARRAKGRAALVVAMIALPVLFLAFAAASYDMFHLTKGERATRLMGAGDAYLSWQFDGPLEQPVADDFGYSFATSGTTGASHSTDQLLAALPTGSRAIRYTHNSVRMRTANGVGFLEEVELDAADPLARGTVSLRRGRAPGNGGEVAASASALTRLGVRVGGRVVTSDGAHAYTVVGVVEFPGKLADTLVFRPGTAPSTVPDEQSNPDSAGWIVDTPGPLPLAQVHALNGRGMIVMSRVVLLDPPPTPHPEQGSVATDTLSLGAVVAGVALLEIVLLAGPAFAVGARRRQRDLALVAANGGTPAQQRRLVLADGVLLGLVAGVTGLAGGVLAAFAGRPLLELHVMHYRAGGYRVFPTALLAIAGLAVLTGLLAALVPAFVAARQDVVAALAGRRGIPRSRKRWLFAGFGLCLLGVLAAGYGATEASANLIVGGLALGELGLVLCTPALVGLIARAGRLLPAAPRIALRDSARNRAAAAPAISAVMAAVAGSVAIGVYLGASHQRDVDNYQQTLPTGYGMVTIADVPGKPPVDAVSQVLRGTLPTTRVIAVEKDSCPPAVKAGHFCQVAVTVPAERACPFTPDRPLPAAQQRRAAHDPRCAGVGWGDGNLHGGVRVDDGQNLAALTQAAPADVTAGAAVLRAGGVIVPDPRYLVDGRVTLVTTIGVSGDPGTAQPSDPPPAPQTRTVTVPGYAIGSGVSRTGQFPVMSHAALTKAGLAAEFEGLVAVTSRMPGQAEQDRVQARLAGFPGAYQFSVERGPRTSAGPMSFILALVAGAIALGAAGIATGLAAADGRADIATLAAVGAAPWVRRVLSLSQSGVIAGLGSLLGSAAGLGAAFAVLTALNRPWADMWPAPTRFPLVVPWLNLGIALLAVPAIAMLSAGLLTRSRLPIERRRAT